MGSALTSSELFSSSSSTLKPSPSEEIGRRPLSQGRSEASSANYDALIIGSGMSGLSCGVLLAKQGWRVLIIEAHAAVGGAMHTFIASQGKHRWMFDVGVHHVPGVLAHSRLFNWLCGDAVGWCPFDDVHDTAALASSVPSAEADMLSAAVGKAGLRQRPRRAEGTAVTEPPLSTPSTSDVVPTPDTSPEGSACGDEAAARRELFSVTSGAAWMETCTEHLPHAERRAALAAVRRFAARCRRCRIAAELISPATIKLAGGWLGPRLLRLLDALQARAHVNTPVAEVMLECGIDPASELGGKLLYLWPNLGATAAELPLRLFAVKAGQFDSRLYYPRGGGEAG